MQRRKPASTAQPLPTRNFAPRSGRCHPERACGGNARDLPSHERTYLEHAVEDDAGAISPRLHRKATITPRSAAVIPSGRAGGNARDLSTDERSKLQRFLRNTQTMFFTRNKRASFRYPYCSDPNGLRSQSIDSIRQFEQSHSSTPAITASSIFKPF